MIGLMLPFFFLAMYEKDGQPAEKVLRNIVRTRLYFPGKRPYKTENFFEIIETEGNTIASKTTPATQAPKRKHTAIKSQPHRPAKNYP